MRIKTLSILIVGTALLAVSCGKKAGENTIEPATQEVDAVATPTPEAAVDTTSAATGNEENAVIEVTGKVTEIIQGKDGYMAKLTTADNKKYTATISIPNLNDPKQFRAVKVGDNITVKGNVTNLESDVLIIVRELK
ncbi:MAG: hypothetical protein DI539_20735 [Flavobacterium psychrophilum]|nr:MAG: hypothetical protein DI539_20735 [Flavobacterium psychrophilum]